ncbi:MAG TPA: DUF2092 domain-containing protein [Planctomycetota bacterium]|nr:DUF2092 domain-containing protein [Planctomycetota bacterium]
MPTLKWSGIAGLALVLLQQDGPPNATEVLDLVSASLRDKTVVQFETEMRTRIQSLAFSQKAKVILKRPNLARMEISGAGQDAVIVLDGKSLWHLLKARNRFVRTKQLGTAKIEQYGAGPAGSLFYEGGLESIKPYLSSATVSNDTLDGRECRIVAWSVGAEETKLWIDGVRLRKFRTTRSLGDQSVEQTVTYGDMTFPATVESSAFTFTPPAGCEALASTGEERLLKPGTKLPDVSGLDLRGHPLTLSDFRGRPLLVTFWFHG